MGSNRAPSAVSGHNSAPLRHQLRWLLAGAVALGIALAACGAPAPSRRLPQVLDRLGD